MQEPCSINVFEVKINTKILSISIQEFIIKHDYLPYIIMNETTLNKMENFYIDHFASIGGIINIKPKEKTIVKFEGCTILIDDSLNDGEVLLR